MRAVFTNRGAHLKSWTLKKYLDLQKQPQELVPTYLRRVGAAAVRPEGRRRRRDGAHEGRALPG